MNIGTHKKSYTVTRPGIPEPVKEPVREPQQVPVKEPVKT